MWNEDRDGKEISAIVANDIFSPSKYELDFGFVAIDFAKNILSLHFDQLIDKMWSLKRFMMKLIIRGFNGKLGNH